MFFGVQTEISYQVMEAMASQKENQRMTNPAERQRKNGPVNKKTVFVTFSLVHQQAPFIFKNTHFLSR